MIDVHELLSSYKRYKDKADSFHYSADTKYETIEKVCNGLFELRELCEVHLPRLAVDFNSLTEAELKSIYSANQKINLDDYGIKLLAFELILNPSQELSKTFELFRKTVKII